MKRILRVRLSAAAKRSLLPLSILSLALLLLASPVLATTPITVSIYQDMESGNAGDVLTASIMTASNHGGGSWTAPSGTMWVATKYHRDLPGPVLVGGTTYNGTGGSRSWKFSNTYAMNFVSLQSFGSYSNISEGAYYTTDTTLTSYNNGYDVMIMWGMSSYQCMQTIVNNGFVTNPFFHCHSQTSVYVDTNNDPTVIGCTPGKTYWTSMAYDGASGEVSLATFDPDNNYVQLGTTLHVIATYNDLEARMSIGRGDNHGTQSNDTNYAYFDQIIVDYANAAFPLLPSGCNDTTAPGAPPSVRDGTGADQSIALSTTQLSANWDMAWDAESGIKGYQYAIGTAQGGTNIVNWTTLINTRGVTKTGLSLTTGQTYYFSVKAINGVGLTGPAANSNGQTVGTDTTAPGAPPAVRDNGWYNYNPDIDETTDSTDLIGNWDVATDNESGISGYQYAFGTTVGGTNVVNWTNSPANYLNINGWALNAWVRGGVTLVPGTRYYFTVRAVNNAGLVGPATNSNGLVLVNSNDTTPPSAPPAVRDGTGPTETSTTASTTQLSANWDNSNDNESGISGYYYAIGTTLGGTNILNDTRVTYGAPVTSVTKTGLSLTVGQTYYFRIKAINGVNLTGSATNSSGVTVVSGTDTTPPSAPPAVRDGTGADISTTISTTQLSANWDASTDNESGISGYQYAIGTSAGGTQTVNWTSLGNVTTVTRTGLTLSVGQTYYFSVKAVNGFGLTGSATNSNGQTVTSDATPPSAPPAVRDGVGADISTTASTTQLSANWDASTDNESGISGYQYAIGTTAGGTQTVNWTSLGNVTTVTKTGLTLSVGQTYFFSVKAVNGVGLTGSAANSNGQTVVTDSTPPSAPPSVRDGTGADIAVTNSTTQLSANWDASTDNESGISGYQYAIGTTAGGTQTVNWTSLGNVTTVTKTGLSLSVGQTYFFSVKAVNGAGLTGSATNSNGQTVATTTTYFSDNFESWSVHGGAWTSVSGETGGNSLDTSTDQAAAGAKSLKMTCAAGATSGAYLTKNFSPNYISGDIYIRFYAFFPTAMNMPTTNYCLLHIVPGNSGSENGSNYADVQLQNGQMEFDLIGNWQGGSAWVFPSAVSQNQWHCIEAHISPCSTTSIMETWLDGAKSATTLSADLSHATTIDYILFGDSNGGTASGATYYLDEVVVANSYIGPLGSDNTPPSAPPTVRDGTGADISTTGSTTQLSANWDASTDAESGISGYQYAIGTSAGGTQTVNWTVLGNVTTVTKTGLSLSNGQTYYFSVQAVNGVGLTGSATNSNGQTVQTTDVTPPSAPANVRDGVGADISTTSSTTQLSANWDAATDAESGISGYQYAIGTSAGGTQTVNWTSLGNVTTVTKTGLTLSVGQTYFFSVKAVNGVGLTGPAANSNGQTVVAVSNVVYFSDNFESWTVHGGAWSSVNGETSTHTLNTSTDYARAGSKSLKITDTDTTATTGASLTKNFSPVISGDIYVRFFIFLPTGYGSANSTCSRRIVRVYTDTGNYTVITLAGASLFVSEVGGWSGTGTTAISENAWHCVELHVAPPSASTAIQIWIDGVSAGTCTGAFSGSSTFNYMQFGDVALASGATNGTGTIYWDELVVSNYYNGTIAATTYFSDNFENWTVHGGVWSSVSGETATQTQNTSTDYARAGTKSLKLTDSDTTNSYGACLVKTFSPTISSAIYVRFYVYLPTAYVSANTGAAYRRLLRVFCGSNRGQISLNSSIAPLMEEVGAWGASTAPAALSANAWHCIEMYIASPSASTPMQFWVDGTSAGTLNGSFSGSTVFTSMEFGDVSVGGGANVTGTFYLDEVIASDTYNGPLP